MPSDRTAAPRTSVLDPARRRDRAAAAGRARWSSPPWHCATEPEQLFLQQLRARRPPRPAAPAPGSAGSEPLSSFILPRTAYSRSTGFSMPIGRSRKTRPKRLPSSKRLLERAQVDRNQRAELQAVDRVALRRPGSRAARRPRRQQHVVDRPPSALPTAFTSASGSGSSPGDPLGDARLALEARRRVRAHQRELRDSAVSAPPWSASATALAGSCQSPRPSRPASCHLHRHLHAPVTAPSAAPAGRRRRDRARLSWRGRHRRRTVAPRVRHRQHHLRSARCRRRSNGGCVRRARSRRQSCRRGGTATAAAPG